MKSQQECWLYGLGVASRLQIRSADAAAAVIRDGNSSALQLTVI